MADPADRSDDVAGLIEDLLIAARIRERLGNDDGTRFTLEEAAEQLGLESE